MIEGSLRQQDHQLLLKGRQVSIGALIGRDDGRLAQRLSVKVLANLGEPLKRNKMLLVKINHLGFEAGTILSRSVDLLRKAGRDQATGERAPFDFGLMLGHLQRLVRQFKDLALFITENRLMAQGAPWTLAAGA